MLIRSLLLENYRQYRGCHKLDLPVDVASEKNIVLIGGLNGAGKTSILEGLRLALFGKANEDLWSQTSYKAFLRQCLNKQAASEGVREFRLVVVLEVGDVQSSTALTIERRWRFNSHLDFSGESLTLYSNGKEKLGLSSEDAELYIQERIPYGVSRFVFFDGEKIQDLARDDVFPNDTRDAIRSILGLRVHQELEHDLWLYERSLLREHAHDEEFRLAEQALERAQGQLEALRRQKASLNRDLADANRELEQIQSERKRLGNRQLRDRRGIDDTLVSLRSQRETIQKSLVNFVSHDLPMLTLQPLLVRLRKRLEEEIDLEQRTIVRSLLANKKEELLKSFRLIGGIDIERVSSAWDMTLGPMPGVSTLRHRNLSIEQKYALISRIDATAGHVSVQAQGLLRQMDAIESKIRKVLQDKRALPADPVHLDLEERERELLAHIRVISAELGGLSVQEKMAEHEYATAKRSYEAAESKVSLAHGIQAKVEKARQIREAVTEFINRLAVQKATEVERYLTRMFLDLARKHSIVAEFSIDPSTFAVGVTDASGNQVELQTLSAGEKEIFAISFLWALSKAAVRELPMVIDTPLGRLDSVHRAHIAERFLPHANRQVIVLSTDSEIDKVLYERISDYVAAEFLVEFDVEGLSTRIRPGYFFDREVAESVR
ncbi:MAG: DNA sulfur modification protein DndD [Bacillota bacterium]